MRGRDGPVRRILRQKQKTSIGEDAESSESQAEAWDFDVLYNSNHHLCVCWGGWGRREKEKNGRGVLIL